jgi:hypothetical protein
VPQEVLGDKLQKAEMNAYASYDIGTAEEREELHDTPEEVERKVKELAQLIRGSQHMVAFTGAGIST